MYIQRRHYSHLVKSESYVHLGIPSRNFLPYSNMPEGVHHRVVVTSSVVLLVLTAPLPINDDDDGQGRGVGLPHGARDACLAHVGDDGAEPPVAAPCPRQDLVVRHSKRLDDENPLNIVLNGILRAEAAPAMAAGATGTLDAAASPSAVVQATPVADLDDLVGADRLEKVVEE